MRNILVWLGLVFGSALPAAAGLGSSTAGGNMVLVVGTVTATAPLGVSGAVSPTFSITAADGSTDGYLKKEDWTKFDTKQSTGADASTLLNISSVAVGAVLDASVVSLTPSKLSAGALDSDVIASSLAVAAVVPSVVAAGTYSNITLPAANVASGSLGGSVIASSIAVAAVYDAAILDPKLSLASGGTVAGALIISGSIQLKNVALATIQASTPTAKGQKLFCTDCTVTPEVVSTGTTNCYDWSGTGSFAQPQ